MLTLYASPRHLTQKTTPVTTNIHAKIQNIEKQRDFFGSLFMKIW